MDQTSPSTTSVNLAVPEDEFAHFAQLTGFQDAAGSRSSLASDAASNELPLLDEDDLQDNIDGQKTQIQLWSNPYAKVVSVGGLFAIATAAIGLFVLSANPIRHSTTAGEPAPVPAVSATAADSSSNEIGDLKTQTALETQAAAIRAANIPPSSVRSPTAPVGAVSAAAASPPRSVPSFDASPVVRAAAPRLSDPAPSTPPIDPTQAWQNAQAIGSYGQVTYAAVPSPSHLSSDSLVSADDANPGDQQAYQADEAAILTGTVRQWNQVSPGAIASGRLETPIIWAQDLDASQQPQRFAMTLSQPLMGANGTVALPAGAVLILSVGGVDQSGLVSLAVVGAIAPSDHSPAWVSLPSSALSITAEGNKPLMAEPYNGASRHIANLDRNLALMGGLAQLGQFVTNPSASTTAQGLTSTVTTTTNRRVNPGSILGAVLDGAFGALQQQVSQRNTQQIRDLLQRPKLWYIPADQTLQIVANESFEVGS
ncbi:MAG TPA: hypothetical protein V6C88_03505 [Chroococcidiopsis sp.]